MTRLARPAWRLLAFFLLTSAATAHAECACVLWVEVAVKSETQPWKSVDASSTESGCRRKMAQRIKHQADMYSPTRPADLPKGFISLTPHIVIIVGDDRTAKIHAFDGPEEYRWTANELKTTFAGAQNSVIVIGGPKDELRMETHQCLPDTVDPRGPKGK
jgi:hypothetical protein